MVKYRSNHLPASQNSDKFQITWQNRYLLLIYGLFKILRSSALDLSCDQFQILAGASQVVESLE
jgi:hypothetical protein